MLGLDLTPAVVEAACARAHDLGVRNVAFQVLTTETELPVPAASVERAICAFGLMYMPAPVRALRALHTALRPGGRIAVSTLAAPPVGSCRSILSAVLARHSGWLLFDPARAGPFALGSPAALRAPLTAAGFVQVTTYALQEEPDLVEHAAAYWERLVTQEPTAPLLAVLPPETVTLIHDEVVTTLAPQFRKGAVDLAGQALFATGTKSG